MFSYQPVLTYVLGAQKNHLTEMVLLSAHNICFGCDIRKNFCYALLTVGLQIQYVPNSHVLLNCSLFLLT